MKKVFYESPLCVSMELDPESTIMQLSGGDAFGAPGAAGNDLDILGELTF